LLPESNKMGSDDFRGQITEEGQGGMLKMGRRKLHNIHTSPNIVNGIISRRLRWMVHAQLKEIKN
jgi:hypothetical protein